MPPLLLALMLATQPTPTPDETSVDTLAGLQRTFADACSGRLYGQYDDMCTGLADQIRAYRAEARRRPRPRPAPPPAPADTPPPDLVLPAAHAPLPPAPR